MLIRNTSSTFVKVGLVVLSVLAIDTNRGEANEAQLDFAKHVAQLNFSIDKCASVITVDQSKLQTLMDEWHKDLEGPDKKVFESTFAMVSHIEAHSFEQFPKIYCEVSLPVLQSDMGEKFPFVLKAVK
jgi:hypothetical protein